MATCKITSLKTMCAYNAPGIDRIWLVDSDDFDGYEFQDQALYSACLVTAVQRHGPLVEVDSPDAVAKYTSSLNGNLYTHTLETFVEALTADTLAALHLARRRKYTVIFKTVQGLYFTFSGAKLTYTGQTADNIGALITLTATSIYPLFEALADVITNEKVNAEFVPDFDNNIICN